MGGSNDSGQWSNIVTGRVPVIKYVVKPELASWVLRVGGQTMLQTKWSKHVVKASGQSGARLVGVACLALGVDVLLAHVPAQDTLSRERAAREGPRHPLSLSINCSLTYLRKTHSLCCPLAHASASHTLSHSQSTVRSLMHLHRYFSHGCRCDTGCERADSPSLGRAAIPSILQQLPSPSDSLSLELYHSLIICCTVWSSSGKRRGRRETGSTGVGERQDRQG